MLDTIIARTRQRVADLVGGESDLRAEAEARGPAKDFARALRTDRLAVIAEVKRRSPSAGEMAPSLDPAAQAAAYQRGGAAAISVLTEPEFFAGSMADLCAVRAAVDVPLLRKDFTIHPVQVWEARAAGADAILLIVAALDRAELGELLDVAANAGMAAVVEAHTAAEASTALDAGARIVGVNNRDLATFSTDLTTAESIAPLLPSDVVRIAESGVASPTAAVRMRNAGYDAILVGEALVKADDPEALVAGLRV